MDYTKVMLLLCEIMCLNVDLFYCVAICVAMHTVHLLPYTELPSKPVNLFESIETQIDITYSALNIVHRKFIAFLSWTTTK